MALEPWQQLQEADYQNNWVTVEGKGTLYAGQPSHGALLTTYLDPGAAGAEADKPGAMPEWAIIIKENYMPDETLDAVTVMYKESGFDPDHN